MPYRKPKRVRLKTIKRKECPHCGCKEVVVEDRSVTQGPKEVIVAETRTFDCGYGVSNGDKRKPWYICRQSPSYLRRKNARSKFFSEVEKAINKIEIPNAKHLNRSLLEVIRKHKRRHELD